VQKKYFLNNRQQIFAVGFIVWALLAAWTISAFWAHISTLQEEYETGAKIGALGGEFVALAFLWWHCFHVKLGVRRWALIFSCLLAGVLLLHAGAVRGLKAAKIEQASAEQRFAENAARLAQAQTVGAGEAVGRARAAGGSPREAIRMGVQIAQSAGREATQNLRELTAAGTEKVQRSTIFPAGYIRDWMYSAIFLLSVVLLSALFWVMATDDQVDADFNGVADRDERAVWPAESVSEYTDREMSAGKD